MRKNHPDLFPPLWITIISNFKEYAFDRNRWWLILCTVISVFIIGAIINVEFFHLIDIDGPTAKILVDQRVGNIAAITAITLVVVGFLINNLAVKESFAYRLLFKHSYLYPVIYFTLSTIGCFFVVSTLRDELQSQRFINTVLAGTYLVLIVLFLIGFLFKKIIEFSNDRTIRWLLHNELILEATRNLKIILIKKYSSEIYKQTVIEKGAKEYNWAEALDLAKSEVEFKELSEDDINAMKKKEKRIYDVNLSGLKKFISKKQKKSGQIYYQDLAIEKSATEYDNYLWQKDNPNTEKDKSKLRKLLVLKNPRDHENDKESVRKYFDQKLEALSSNSEHRNLEDLLDSYYAIYQLQMKHQK
jgi:hypothetical protein